jgi:hypothetical protein
MTHETWKNRNSYVAVPKRIEMYADSHVVRKRRLPPAGDFTCSSAVVVAEMIQQRFNQFTTDSLIQLVATQNSNRDGKPFGLYTTIDQQPPQQREALIDILFNAYRSIQLPDELKGWYEVDYDDSQWERGRAPIGVGVHNARGVSIENNSDWGKGGVS